MRHAFVLLSIVALGDFRSAHADGPLDPTFSYNYGAPYTYFVNSGDATAVSIAQDAAGHLITGGYSSSDGRDQLFVSRHTNIYPISKDTGFGIFGDTASPFGSLVDNGAVAIALDHHDRIVAAGYSRVSRACGTDADHSVSFFAAARFINDGTDDDGESDLTFGPGFFPGAVGAFVGDCAYTYPPVALLVSDDDEITIGGTAWNGSYRELAIVRWDSSGALDPSFGDGGVITYDYSSTDTIVTGMAKDSRDRVLVLAITRVATSVSHATIFRFEHDGALDASFGHAGIAQLEPGVGEACCIVIDSSGRIVIAGSISATSTAPFQIFVARFNESGSVDETFGNAGLAATSIAMKYSSASSLALDERQRPIVAGEKTDFGYAEAVLVHFNLDGSLNKSVGFDGVYSLPFGLSYSNARALLIDSLSRPNVSIYASDRDGAVPAIVRYDEMFGDGFD